MMLKFSIVVVCLLAASLCREVDGNFKTRVQEALKNHRERIERLETAVFGSKKTYVDLIIDYGVVDPELREYNVSINVGIDVFEMMQEAKKQFDDFTFEFTTFHKLGHFINSINGVAGSTADKTYWSFENRNGVPFDRGVDWIKVHYDDAIKFRFTTYNSTTDHP